ncbi:MAG: hypothetical protein JNL08_21700 [Planctomycetes bacterium]|nr:hypothetical protein [Planctomycetota bacterium]
MARGALGSLGAAAAQVLLGALLVAYPIVVWFGLNAQSPRLVAAALLCVMAPIAALRLRRSDRAALRGVAFVPLATVAVLSLSALLDAAGLLLAVPVVINAIFLVLFGASLRRGAVPMVERFARLQEAHLSPEQQAWCRLWTGIWCAFFVANGGTALVLAVAAPLSWWTTYNGLVAYVLMGVLFAIEWTVRRRRFSRG